MTRFERSPLIPFSLLTALLSALLGFANGCANSNLLQSNGQLKAPLSTTSEPAELPGKDSTRLGIGLVDFQGPAVEEPANGASQVASAAVPSEEPYEIDLWHALQLGGADGLMVQLARQRVEESHSGLLQAQASWLPSVRFGVGYNRHDGPLQSANGEVIRSSRNSLFLGGGMGLGQVPLAGGAGGPPRMMINFSLADAYFEPLVAERRVTAEVANQDSTFNDAHLQVALAYIELLEAHALHTNARQSQQDIQALVKLTTLFAQEGAGSQVEVDRAKTELAQHRLTLLNAARLIQVRNIRLVQLLHLNSRQQLSPREEVVHPIILVEEDHDTQSLINEGLERRPELLRQQAALDAAILKTSQESWRPWLPNVQVGASGGSFGGGPSGRFGQQAARGDLDLLAFWEWRNLGLGDQAALWQRDSQLQQIETSLLMLRDQVAAEVTAASLEILNYRSQMLAALETLKTAKSNYQRNYQRVHQAEGLPLELLQAIRAQRQSRDAYTRSVTGYNQAQFRLLRAIGQFPQPADEEAAP